MSKETISINVVTLTKQVEEGMKKAALAEYYGIPVSQMTAALKQAGLKIRKFHKPAFVLVTDDVATEEIDNPVTSPVTDAPAEVAEEAVTAETPNIWKD
jgi:hypothetical protein